MYHFAKNLYVNAALVASYKSDVCVEITQKIKT
jgi:hypothetical protein